MTTTMASTPGTRRKSLNDRKFPPVQVLSVPRSDCKVFGLTRGVQLIIWFAVIRKSLKKEIYGCDKGYFCLMKTKNQFGTGWRIRR
jgi:hypothetical protein